MREKMTEILIAKAQARAEAKDLTAAYLANGGKVHRLPNQGVMPKFSKHYCRPQDRGMLNHAMVGRGHRPAIARAHWTMGESKLIRAW